MALGRSAAMVAMFLAALCLGAAAGNTLIGDLGKMLTVTLFIACVPKISTVLHPDITK